jgi:cation transport ATPase
MSTSKSDQPQYEKEEKFEKEEEKSEKDEEKTSQEKEEKDWEEKWRRDPLGAAIWAVILIWAGLVLLVENIGLFSRLRVGDQRVEAWPIILMGAGIIVLVEIAIRLLVPAYRRPVGGSIVFAAVLIGVGLANLVGWNIGWAIVLIAVGVGMLLRGLIRGS